MEDYVADVLSASFSEVVPIDYYRALFPPELMEGQGEYREGRYCGIALQIDEEGRARRVHLTKGFPQLDSLLASDDFSITAPVLFAGREASNQNARWLTALEFDLDFLRTDKSGEPVGIHDLLYQTSISEPDYFNRLPRPTYLIQSSERNLHVVYLLDKPLAMYPPVLDSVRRFRRAFIPKLWDSWITEASKKPQFETSPVQAFRLVGSESKSHEMKVRCYLTGDPVSIETLNEYVDEHSRIQTRYSTNKMSLEKARELYPEWYARRVEKSTPKDSWVANRGLYDWWKRKLPEIQVGHRYHYLLCMAVYAYKCGVSLDELTNDVMVARKELDRISPPNNPLKMSDATKALQAYQERFRTMRRETIAELSGVEITPAKRNGRTQKVHLAIARSTLAILNEENGRALQGRKSCEEEVIEYVSQHPGETVTGIARALGVSRKTVHKWLRKSRNTGLE